MLNNKNAEDQSKGASNLDRRTVIEKWKSLVDLWDTFLMLLTPLDTKSTLTAEKDIELMNYTIELLENSEKIVYCKDCIHRPSAEEGYGGWGSGNLLNFPSNNCPCQCEDPWYSWLPDDDWFCKNGENKWE